MMELEYQSKSGVLIKGSIANVLQVLIAMKEEFIPPEGWCISASNKLLELEKLTTQELQQELLNATSTYYDSIIVGSSFPITEFLETYSSIYHNPIIFTFYKELIRRQSLCS